MTTRPLSVPYVPPPYPYDRLDEIKAIASSHRNGSLDLSIGTPNDAPPPAVVAALSSSDTERGYPPSIGTPAFREAAAQWLNLTVGADITREDVRAAVGTKEFVAGLPHWLKLRRPDLDTVLYPAVSYPSYAMGADLANCRAVPVPVDDQWRIRLDMIDEADAARALCLWVNTPGNPAGGIDDLGQAAAWGRKRSIPVFSDECYAEFTWSQDPVSILQHGTEGVVALHSLSKRSNLAGVRSGFYAGDAELLHYLSEVRKHLGFIVPGPVQAASVVAFADQAHVEDQRQRYMSRLVAMQSRLADMGVAADLPGGGFYLWVRAPNGDGWDFARQLATELGVVGSPGEFYGDAARNHVRLAMVWDLEAERIRG